ncbi:T9SS type A sorting domain-containing protein [Candidatus Marinimicrobia bacterium MT.SAG.4]|nr:T9SS type A sorting domain-containing protein [Candidatus Marinimicrobia bacterium MT.SAG.4]
MGDGDEMEKIIRTKILLLCLAVVLTVSHTAFAQVSVFPEFLNFDDVAAGQTVSRPLVIKNQGDTTIVVNDINLSHSYFRVSNTSFFIDPNDSQIVVVTFSPQEQGIADGTMSIIINDSSELTLEVDLTGWTPIDMNVELVRNESSTPISFNLQKSREFLLHLRVSSETNWSIPDSQSAVLTIYIDSTDGPQNQDIVLFKGNELFVYKASLGRIDSGSHSIEVYFNGDKSPSGAQFVFLDVLSLVPIALNSRDYDVFRFSPVLYGRDLVSDDESVRTDIPLLMWHEVDTVGSDKWIEYSMIWSNEDGGTNSVSLMSRWGRTTDIEWFYRVKISSNGNVLEEYFQGPGHSTTFFQGNKINDHPILKTVTINNMVSDVGVSNYKFFLSPERSKHERHSREILMDEDPWTYEIMALEMIAEGKYESPADPFSSAVSDARNYLYLEFNTQMAGDGLRLTFAAKLKNDPFWYYSDHGLLSVGVVNWGGWRRSTIELWEGTTLNDLDSLQIMGSASGSFSITFEELSKVFLLDEDFALSESPLLFSETFVLNENNSSIRFSFDELTSIGGGEVVYAPKIFLLSQNYPNPFNAITTIQYQLSAPSEVVLTIYNVRGQEVLRFVESEKPHGYHQITWNATNVASGVYFYRLQVGDFVQTRKMLLLK